jgi:hypothetical protein
MLINKGKFNNKQVLTEESVNTLLSLAGDQPMKNVPASMQGLNYTLGSWAIDKDGNGKVLSATSPSLSGTWPIVDLCRGYSLVLITSPLQNPPAKEFYLDLKSIVDQGIQCK